MHFSQFHRKATHIDAIQPQDGALGREASTRQIETAERPTKGLDHSETMGQQFIGLVPPVIEVAGDDEGRVRIGKALQGSGEGIHLPASRAGKHGQVYTDTMKQLRHAR